MSKNKLELTQVDTARTAQIKTRNRFKNRSIQQSSRGTNVGK